MRFHVVGLPNTQTNREHLSCAFTAKVFNFCRMMKSLGHTVFHYGCEGSDTGDDVVIMTKREQEAYFGPPTGRIHDMDWTGKAPYWKQVNTNAAKEINKRKQKGDFVCLITGHLSTPLVEAVEGNVIINELGCGYNGLLPRKVGRYRVYESYSHMHKIAGAEGGYDPDGYLYDCVIPNYFQPDDFPLQVQKDDYYLYLGRLVSRKGVNIAVETCKHLGVKLKLAGGGCTKVEGNRIYCADGAVYEGDNLEYVGFATGEMRAKLYGGAIATLMFTRYLEPLGAVAIESQFAGTPVITTNFGSFPELIDHGRTGFRCHTFDHCIWAAKHAHELDPTYIHEHAVANWSLDRVRWMYQEYYEMLTDLWGKGWYTIHPDRTQLDWLKSY